MTKQPSTALGRFIDRHVRMVIRPPRHRYQIADLGPSVFNLGRHAYERKDVELENHRGQKLLCSHFQPHECSEESRPCVIYLHGNAASRVEAVGIKHHLLKRGLSVFCLDFSGSGMSEGEYISLGWHEEQDLKVVIEHLRAQPSVASIGLWGRSMGAATAILRAADDHEIGACVLDSAFADLSLVAEEVVRTAGHVNLPHFLIKLGLQIMRSEIGSMAGFDLQKVNPIEYAARAVCPALFGVAGDDNFVLPHHTFDVCEAWGGHRVLHAFEGGHNGRRPQWFLHEAADFLSQRLHTAAGMAVPERPTPQVVSLGLVSPDSSPEKNPEVPVERSVADMPPPQVDAPVARMRPCLRTKENTMHTEQELEGEAQCTPMSARSGPGKMLSFLSPRREVEGEKQRTPLSARSGPGKMLKISSPRSRERAESLREPEGEKQSPTDRKSVV